LILPFKQAPAQNLQAAQTAGFLSRIVIEESALTFPPPWASDSYLLFERFTSIAHTRKFLSHSVTDKIRFGRMCVKLNGLFDNIIQNFRNGYVPSCCISFLAHFLHHVCVKLKQKSYISNMHGNVTYKAEFGNKTQKTNVRFMEVKRKLYSANLSEIEAFHKLFRFRSTHS